jgi:hypothetical protein
VPSDVLNVAATVANEVMMVDAIGAKSRGSAFHRHFAH